MSCKKFTHGKTAGHTASMIVKVGAVCTMERSCVCQMQMIDQVSHPASQPRRMRPRPASNGLKIVKEKVSRAGRAVCN